MNTLPTEYYYLKIGKAPDLFDKKERRIYRFLEMMPGILAWSTLALLVLLSWLTPIWIAFFIIAFDVYWLLKTIYLSLHLRSGFKKVRANIKINWLERLELEKSGWKEFYHLIILPMYKEDWVVVSATLDALAAANYPKDKMIVVLGIEERAGEAARQVAKEAEKEFGDKFFKFLITVHPKDIEGEIAGKGSNIAFAGREAKEKIIDSLGIDYGKVIVSAFDIDTVIWSEYFSRLAYAYMSSDRPERKSFQPIPFYINNIWQAPAVARVISFSATFWHTLQQERPERMTTFSSHSMSLRALIGVDFWQTNMVSEDSRIFWQCFLRYDGDYEVVPLYYPVSMDANAANSFVRTLGNIYKQQRRWAYGAADVAYFLFGFLKNKKIPKAAKFHFGYFVTEGFYSWATNAILIFALGWLPLALGSEEFNTSLLSYNLPRITRILLTIAMLGIMSSVFLSLILLPPRPPKYGRGKYLIMVFQWVMVPISLIFFGAFPSIEAQTRLMLGKYLGFWATEKFRK